MMFARLKILLLEWIHVQYDNPLVTCKSESITPDQ